MQPTDPSWAPQNQPPMEPQPQAAPRASKHRRTLALWLLVGPSALFVVAVLVGILAPIFFPDKPPTDENLFGEPSVARTIANIFVFASGAVVILTWLPGLIIGSILLRKGKSA